MTKRTRSISVMSFSGSPATATRSANLPFSIDPTRSDQPMISAFRLVAETIADMGVAPNPTRTVNSRAFLPCGVTPESVAKPIGSPAASARLKPATVISRICLERSTSDSGAFVAPPSIASLTVNVGT